MDGQNNVPFRWIFMQLYYGSPVYVSYAESKAGKRKIAPVCDVNSASSRDNISFLLATKHQEN